MTRLRVIRQRAEDGNALVEFTYLAVLLMVPLIYVLITVFFVQRAAFGTTEAARQAARAYARADSTAQGERSADDAVALALKDQGIGGGESIDIRCLGGDCLAAGSRVKVTVVYNVKLPVLGAVFKGHDRGTIRVQASHVEYVDRYR